MDVATLSDLIEAADDPALARLRELYRELDPILLWSPGPEARIGEDMHDLLADWRRQRGDAMLPPEAAIDPFTFREHLGDMHVLEPNGDFSDFRYRIFGTRIGAFYPHDHTGDWVSDIVDGGAIARYYVACYRAVALRRLPLFNRTGVVRLQRKWARLLLPYGDDAKGVTRVLTYSRVELDFERMS